MEPTSAWHRPVGRHRVPEVHRVVPGPCPDQTPSPGARRTRRPGRAGLVTVRHRLRQRPHGQRGPLKGPNPTDRGKSGSKIHLIVGRKSLPPLHRHLRRRRARQPGLRTASPRDTAHPLPTRTPQTMPGETPRLQGIQLPAPAPMVAGARDHPTHHPPRSRKLPTARPTPVGRRTHHGLARRIPTSTPPLRTQGRHCLAFTTNAATLICYRRLPT